MNKNYQKILECKIDEIIKSNKTPTLFLHSCCAPCSSYVLEYLSDFFSITVYYYNPNITIKEEYFKRVFEQQRFIEKINHNLKNKVSFIEGEHNPELFFSLSKGLEDSKEGGERCFKCYEFRLEQTALNAKKYNFDYFTTTLSISPLKNSTILNQLGEKLSEKYGIEYLFSDFKKKNGYKRSIELSREYDLYRQDYCGCIFSKMEKERKDKENEGKF